MRSSQKPDITHDSPVQLSITFDGVGPEQLHHYEDHRQFCDVLSSKSSSLLSVCDVGNIALLNECDIIEASLNLPKTRQIQF